MFWILIPVSAIAYFVLLAAVLIFLAGAATVSERWDRSNAQLDPALLADPYEEAA